MKNPVTENLIIKKRSDVTCWKVDTDGVCPNTVITLDDGITLIIKLDAESTVCARSGVVLYSLFNPGKKFKLFGGQKPYENCEIYAVDTANDFSCEWALAGAAALACTDPEFGVDAKAIARGVYQHRIRDYLQFVRNFSFDISSDVTREDVREYFRDVAAKTASTYLAPKVFSLGVNGVQMHTAEYTEDLKYILNRNLAEKGVEIVSFAIDAIDYEPSHKEHREELKQAKIDVTIKSVVNDGRRDDISVDKDASEVGIGIIHALNGTRVAKEKKADTAEKAKTVCPRCAEPNDADANYCIRCGEKLGK